VIAAATVREALEAAVDALRAAGCETPQLDAELLLADAMGVGREQVVADPGRAVPADATRRVGGLIRRRLQREPVAYIVGRKAFRRIEVAVDSRVLIPRPETELLVELALELPHGARVHDVGTGSGAVALAIKEERPDLVVSASDVMPTAVDVARANAGRLGLDVTLSVHTGVPDGEYDLVLANLPYVREDEWAELQPEIRLYEPREALVAGADGLDAIRQLVADAPAGTRIALEHSPKQAAAVRDLLREPETRRDLADLARVTVGTVP
jgi:release factor glutamine methyltransferase